MSTSPLLFNTVLEILAERKQGRKKRHMDQKGNIELVFIRFVIVMYSASKNAARTQVLE